MYTSVHAGVNNAAHLTEKFCKFNISFAVMAKHALLFSQAKLSLRIVALLHSPLDTFLFLSLQAIHLLLPTKS
jgi:hypothetical protein